MINYDDVVAYAKKINIAFTRGDIELILKWAQEDNETDVRFPVWQYLDTYEGISHARDPEFFADEFLDIDTDD